MSTFNEVFEYLFPEKQIKTHAKAEALVWFYEMNKYSLIEKIEDS